MNSKRFLLLFLENETRSAAQRNVMKVKTSQLFIEHLPSQIIQRMYLITPLLQAKHAQHTHSSDLNPWEWRWKEELC